MRYELTDDEWTAIRPMLPNKPRGVPRVNDRRVLNGIFWILRSGAPWRDLPDHFGPYTTCYNRFVRWRRTGVWRRIMDALATAHDASVQMIDTSIIRVHQHGACIVRNRRQSMGRSRGGLTSKIHALVDTTGLPVRLALTAGEAHDNRLAGRIAASRYALVRICIGRTVFQQDQALSPGCNALRQAGGELPCFRSACGDQAMAARQ
jgi:transposase